MNSTVKFYSFLILFFLCGLYSLAWIGAAYEARHFFKNILLELDFRGIKVSNSEGIRFSGFPFRFVFHMDDVYINSRSGNVANFEIKKIKLKSDLLMKNFKFCGLEGAKKVFFLKDNDSMRTFSTRYAFDPTVKISLFRAPVFYLLSGYNNKNILGLISSLSYCDKGIEGLDDSRSVIFSDKGRKKVEIFFDDLVVRNDKGKEKMVKQVHVKADCSVQSKESIINYETNKEDEIFNDFFLEAEASVFFPKEFGQYKKKRIKLDIENFKYVSPKHSTYIFGSGIIESWNLLGNFDIEINNYNNFFDSTIKNIMSDEDSYIEFKNLINRSSSKIDENKILLKYRAENINNAKIGNTDAGEIISFVASKLSPDFIASYKSAKLGAAISY